MNIDLSIYLSIDYVLNLCDRIGNMLTLILMLKWSCSQPYASVHKPSYMVQYDSDTSDSIRKSGAWLFYVFPMGCPE